MSIDGAIYSRLSGYAALTALVGLRIYPIVAPEAASYPLVVFTKIANDKQQAHGGVTGLINPTYQVSCWADTASSVRSVADQVVAALQDYSGTLSSTEIQWSFYDNESEMYEPTTKKYHIAITFEIWHT